MRFHYTSIEIVSKFLKVMMIPKVGEDAEKLDCSYFTGGNVKLYSHPERVQQFLKSSR